MSFAPQFFFMSFGKVLKQSGGWVLVTLIEGANERLSIEYNIVVCTSVFYKKNLPFGVGGWDLLLFFRKCKRCPFGIYKFYRLHLTSGGQLHTPKMLGVFNEKKKHKIRCLADMRTTIASNNTKILEWKKFAFS